MNISQVKSNKQLVINISGEFNGSAVLKYREIFEQLPQQTTVDVVFDVSSMTSIDSSGIGLLVFIYKRIKPRGLNMTIVGLNGEPLMLFQMLHIDRIIHCQGGNLGAQMLEAY